MLASFWLAVGGLPVFHQPFPAAPDQPAAIAIASGDVSLRRPCLQLRCPDAEWQPPQPATTYAYREPREQVKRTLLPGAPIPGVRGLPAPNLNRDYVAPYAGSDRVSARYGRTVVDTPTTDMTVEVGTGYRWEPYADNGAADTGVVARGRVQLQKKVGERTRLRQDTRIEAGRQNTYVRNALGVQIELKPQWNLQSDVEVRHDTAANGGSGRTDTEGNVRLEYAF